MPTRIPPYREGYGDNPGSAQPGDAPDGYFCIGILRPCIEQMTGTDFECLPKATCKLMTDVPYYDLTTLKDDLELPVLLDSCDERFDPQDGSLRIDLWGALQRAGLDGDIDTGCGFPYIRNSSEPVSAGPFPIESESSVQIKYCPGYMDPIIIPFPSIGDGSEVDDEIPSSEDESSSGEEDDFEHPFKSRVKPDNPGIIEVGYLRPRFEDHINIIDQTSDKPVGINFPATEEIAVDTSAWYIYYDIYKESSGGAWVAKLEKTNIWPPPCCESDTPPPGTGIYNTYTGNIQRLIGYADTADGANYTWQQHMYENPTEHPIDPRGQFEAWYVGDGKVYIDAGAVDGFNFGGSVSGAEYDLESPTDIWVECKSTHGETSSIAVTGFQDGSYPGFSDFLDCDYTDFNYLIGKIVGKTYVPAHKGKVDIDNTLFMYQAGSTLEYFLYSKCSTGGSDWPRLMMFSEGDGTSPGAGDDGSHKTNVGLSSNPTLYHGYSFGLEVTGGGVESMSSETEYQWYGANRSEDQDFIDISGTAGTALSDNEETGEGSIGLLSRHVEADFDYGLCQEYEITDMDFGMLWEAGDNVWIDYDAGVAAVGETPATPATATIHSRGGLHEGPTENQLITVDGVDGTDFGLGSASVTSRKFTYDVAYGHIVKDPAGLKVEDDAFGNELEIKAGDNIKIAYAAGVATISGDATAACVEDSIEYSTGDCLHLVGDEDIPADWKFYGKNTNKGWFQAEQVTVLTGIQLNGTTLEVKTRQFRVFDLQSESAFGSVTGWATTACP